MLTKEEEEDEEEEEEMSGGRAEGSVDLCSALVTAAICHLWDLIAVNARQLCDIQNQINQKANICNRPQRSRPTIGIMQRETKGLDGTLWDGSAINAGSHHKWW
ncbi:hypothetical protein ACLKA7_001078 [Drosophila subpalustris]